MATVFIQDDDGTEVRIDGVEVTLEMEREEFGWAEYGPFDPYPRRGYGPPRWKLTAEGIESYQMAKPRRIGQHRREVAG